MNVAQADAGLEIYDRLILAPSPKDRDLGRYQKPVIKQRMLVAMRGTVSLLLQVLNASGINTSVLGFDDRATT